MESRTLFSADADRCLAMMGSRRFSIAACQTGALCPGWVKTIISYRMARFFSQLPVVSPTPTEARWKCKKPAAFAGGL
ncbi:hypothetical protein [Achromobacter kerstersii]|uniref:hypothetical protein n=1 Tax=Achromobacter kerstersii TaxID=1353890 RepID=UPI00158177A2|nr:hypothetical protein [Achromobacter kerstersii]